MKEPIPAPKTYSIKALQRGMQVLDAILEARAPLSLERICECTGLVKSTAFRIVSNLIANEYLAQTDKGFWLGIKLLRLGALFEEKLELRTVALPFISSLRDRVNETIHLAVLDDEWRVVILEKLATKQSVGIMMSRVGITTPSYCTGVGKAILAFRPEGDLRRWLRKNRLKRYTRTTITDPEDFLREMEVTRQRGYSIDNGEHEEQIRCIGAPIHDRNGAVGAAVSAAGPFSRMPDPLVGSEIADRVVETAHAISEAIGGRGIASAAGDAG